MALVPTETEAPNINIYLVLMKIEQKMYFLFSCIFCYFRWFAFILVHHINCDLELKFCISYKKRLLCNLLIYGIE